MKKRLLKFGMPLFTLAALLIAIPVFTAAASPGQAKLPANLNKEIHTIQGEVIYITGDGNPASIEITKEDNQKVTFTVNATTEFYIGYTGNIKQTIKIRLSGLKQWIDRRFSKENIDTNKITLPENRGNQLGRLYPSCKKASFADLAIGDRIIARVDGGNVASRILIINTPAVRQVKGEIVVTANTISITKADGTKIDSLKWDVNTKFIIKGSIVVPDHGYGIVTYNSESMTAIMVNLAIKEPD